MSDGITTIHCDVMIYYVYKITVKTTGKSYVGWTKDMEERLNHGHWKNDSYIGRALRKHGLLKYEILSEHATQQEARAEEIVQIALHCTKAPLGYNLTDGGEGMLGYEWTEAQRRKLSHSGKKRYQDPVQREISSKGQKKRYEDPSEVVKARQRTKKYFEDPLNREKTSRSGKKRYEDPVQREISSKGQKKRFSDPLKRAALLKQLAVARTSAKMKHEEEANR